MGIPLVKVCEKCIKEKLRGFNAAVLTDEQRDLLGLPQTDVRYEDVVQEPIDEE
jgi:hypothetical protein